MPREPPYAIGEASTISLSGTSTKDTDMAAKYFERTTQLNPSYALTWVGLSRVSDWQVNVGLVPAEEGHRQLSDL